MTDELDVDRFEEEIRRRYPYPLAATFHRAYYGTPDLDESHDYLLDLFEVTHGYAVPASV